MSFSNPPSLGDGKVLLAAKIVEATPGGADVTPPQLSDGFTLLLMKWVKKLRNP